MNLRGARVVDVCGGFQKHGGIYLPDEVVAEEARMAREWQEQYRRWRAERWVPLARPPEFEIVEV